MIAFLSACPGLTHKSRTMTMFRLSCLCLERVVLALPEVKFGSISGIGDKPDLSEIIRPVQSYLLSCCPQSNICTDAASVSDCLEVLESFAGTTVEPGYSPWVYVDCFDKDEVLIELVTSYKEIRAAAATDEGISMFLRLMLCVSRILSLLSRQGLM